jgi:general secretion pathway protein B
MTDAELQQQAREAELEQRPEPAPVVAPPPEPPARALPPLESIPLQIELPPDLQQALPPLRVDVHVYDDAPENRFVMINLRRYREGDEVADDLTLERVTREGMVLMFRGERFRLLMQN